MPKCSSVTRCLRENCLNNGDQGGIINHLQLKFFRTIAKYCSNYPWIILLSILVASFLLLFGLFNINVEYDQEKLWSSESSSVHILQQKYEKLFGPIYGYIIIVATVKEEVVDQIGRDTIQSKILNEIFILEEKISELVVEGTSLGTECLRPVPETCLKMSPWNFWNYNLNKVLSSSTNTLHEHISWDKVNHPLGFRMMVNMVMGHIKYSPEISTKIESAEAMLISYLLATNTSHVKQSEWVKKVTQTVVLFNSESEFTHFSVGSQASVAQEVERGLLNQWWLMPLSILVMIVFVCASMGSLSIVDSRIGLSLFAIVMLFLVSILSFSICSIFGMIIAPLSLQLLPTLLLSVGIDNMFLMTNTFISYQHRNPLASDEQALSHILFQTGPSISLSSFSLSFVFLACSLITAPMIRTLSIQTALAMIINYFFQIVVLSCAIVIDSRRVKGNRMDLLCCNIYNKIDYIKDIRKDEELEKEIPGMEILEKEIPEMENLEKEIPEMENLEKEIPKMEILEKKIPGIDMEKKILGKDMENDFLEKEIPGMEILEKEIPGNSEKGNLGKGILKEEENPKNKNLEKENPEKENPEKENLEKEKMETEGTILDSGYPFSSQKPETLLKLKLTKVYVTLVSLIVSNIWLIIIVILTFLLLFILSVVMACQVTPGLAIKSLVGSDSYLLPFLDDQVKYFSDEGAALFIVLPDIEYEDPQVQEKMVTLYKMLESHPLLSSISFWYQNFISWIVFLKNHYTEYVAADRKIPSDKFYEWLHEFLDREGRALQMQFVFGENGTIKASRMTGSLTYLSETSQLVDAYSDLTKFLSNSPIPSAYPYAYFFPLIGQFISIFSITSLIMGIVAGGIFLLSLLFLQNFVLSLIVVIILIMEVVEVLALQVLLGLGFNAVSILLLASGVGLGIEYLAHVIQVFQFKKGKTRKEKMLETASEIGSPILFSVLSSIIGLSVLFFIDFPMVRFYFGILWVAVVLNSALHGLLLLPALLVIIPTFGSTMLEDNKIILEGDKEEQEDMIGTREDNTE